MSSVIVVMVFVLISLGIPFPELIGLETLV